MNGRVYDPATSMFFSPDPYVQAPGNWLNYNRYGYCYGNPFRYSDPSGQFIQIIIGALIGGVINWGIHGFQFNLNGLAAFGIGAVGGAIVGATCGAALGTVTAGLGAAGGMSAAGGLGVTMAAAGMGYTAGTLVTSVGNNIFFHDPMPTQNEYLKGLAFTLITAGVMYEIAPPQVIRDTRPIPDPIETPTVGIKPSDVNVGSEATTSTTGNVSEIAEKLKSGLIPPKPNQEFNLMIQEDNYKLTFRVETHQKLDQVFEGVSRNDLIRHANIQLEQMIDGSWIPVQINGTNSENFHIFLNNVLQKNGY